MKKIFLDCGYHLGEGLKEFTEILGINSEWEVYAFEANPRCEINNKIDQHFPIIVNAIEQAIWTNNQKLIFNCEDQDSSKSPKQNSTHKNDGWGSTLQVVESIHSFGEQIEIQALDFSQFVAELPETEIYCKMDIEGAEFAVLRKMIKDQSIKKIKKIWIEWHEGDLHSESSDTAQQLKNELSKYTEIVNWK
jgi:FkbM family methyltransferase